MGGLLENLRLFVSSRKCGACLRLQDAGLAIVEFYYRTTVQSVHVVRVFVTRWRGCLWMVGIRISAGQDFVSSSIHSYIFWDLP